MLREGFEPAIPVFEWAKIFRALDRAATEIGVFSFGYIHEEWQLSFWTGGAALILDGD
jgi:hypothetical protein